MELTLTDPGSPAAEESADFTDEESVVATAANESAKSGAAITRESLGMGLLFLEIRGLWQADKQIKLTATIQTVILLLM